MESQEDDDVYVIKIQVGSSRGYNIFTIDKNAWDEIFSFYEGEDIMYDFEDDDGEVIPINLSQACETAEIVAINPTEEIVEFMDEIEDNTMFNILCNSCSNADKYNKELEYNISSLLSKNGIFNHHMVNAIGYGKNRLISTIGNRKLHITLYEERSGVPQRVMIINIIDTKNREKSLTKTIIGEDLEYKQMIEYIQHVKSLMTSKVIVSDDHLNGNQEISHLPTIESLTDGIVKAQTDDIHEKLMQKLTLE